VDVVEGTISYMFRVYGTLTVERFSDIHYNGSAIVDPGGSGTLSITGKMTLTDTTSTDNDAITTIESFSTLADHSYHVEAIVVGTETDDHDETASYHMIGTFKRDGAVLSQLGTTNYVHEEEDTGTWDCVFDTSGTAIRIRVTGGPATTNVDWISKMTVTQID
jgi:hypothetical protein